MMFLIIINIVNCDNGIDFMCDNANVFLQLHADAIREKCLDEMVQQVNYILF